MPRLPVFALSDNPAGGPTQETIRRDLERFGQVAAGYRDHTVPDDQFRRARLEHGIYALRGAVDQHMIRIRVPGGRLTADQLEAVARATQQIRNGRLHVTTRQDVQVYGASLQQLPGFLTELAAVGLVTRDAAGQGVRNITGCHLAGLCRDELFDVTPYVDAVTRHFLAHPAKDLPRKIKMSVSGCPVDCAMAPVHDIGLVAAARPANGHKAALGFVVWAGGGLGALPHAGAPLEPFTPVQQLLPTCEAVLRVFKQHAGRMHPARARLKFLIADIGIDAFRKQVVEQRRQLVGTAKFPQLPEPESSGRRGKSPQAPFRGGALGRWISTNLCPQRQTDAWAVMVVLSIGDLTVSQALKLAEAARRRGRGWLVLTQSQDVCLPGVEGRNVEALYHDLMAAGLELAEAGRIQDITSCPGAGRCGLGLTASCELAKALSQRLDAPAYQSEDLEGIRIKVSGCPNSCSQHQIAEIGLHGAARRINGRWVPHYQLLAGGCCRSGRVVFGRPVARIPARRVPDALERLIRYYREARRDHEPFWAFVDRVGVVRLRAVMEPFTSVPEGTLGEAVLDWGSQRPFVVKPSGPGECSS